MFLRMDEFPPKEEIEEKLKRSLALLMHHDSHLLEKDVNELSISHRLALYLQQLFDSWDVDCEYNRNLDDKKRLDEDIVRPDIIVHHRGKGNNLMVIEMKKMTSTDEADASDSGKLRKYKEQLGYQYVVFLKIGTGYDHCGEYSYSIL